MNPLETYLKDLRDIRSTGAAVAETSFYPALSNLLNEVGKAIKPKVRCVINLSNSGAGIPDGGLFTPDQLKKNDPNPMQGAGPSRGVIEAKSTAPNVADIVASEQVARYCKKYGLVLVTNYRDFTLVVRDPSGRPLPLESYHLADSEQEFWAEAATPRTLAQKHSERFTGYLLRAMQHNAPLLAPKDLAWFLASYARDALARIKGSNLPALASLRKALEDSLGMNFKGERGEHFFESTLIQTLFYGVFSAWVLWAKEHPPTDKTQFDWMHSASYLRVPVLRKLFYQAADPGQLDALNLSEVLNWATAALNRVDRASFFENFQQHHAVQYFYEPFLEAYDPDLRKQLGVWYTPPEIVEYMVKRVDRVLREELQVEDGLADPRVYVLDPCCGTGAFLVGVLDQIAATLRDKGGDALVSHDLKTAVQQRVFGFEILPAPYVVSHLQLGLRLADLQVPLTGKQRVGVYLTNALTGWEPPKEPQATLPFVEFQEERDAADSVKQSTPILVILGNPPYNGFADIEVGEERDLSTAYRETKKAPKPQGQGLNDLYVRFFRMAERRIVDKTGKGIVCFISNYSWLDGLSHTGMRERYIEAFDKIWIDNLHGDRMMSEYAPDGKTSETIFALRGKSPGIKIGTAISLLVKQPLSAGEQATILYRDLQQAQAEERRAALSASADDAEINGQYVRLQPVAEIGLPLKPREMSSGYLAWPSLTNLFQAYFPGVKTSRDELVVAIHRDKLEQRLSHYFDPKISNEDIRREMPVAIQSTNRFPAADTRAYLVKRGIRRDRVVSYCYRPFDLRWVYWEPETKLLDEKRPDLFAVAQQGNAFLTSRQRGERQREGTPFYVTSTLADYHLTRPGSTCFPLYAPGSPGQSSLEFSSSERAANLTAEALNYLKSVGLDHTCVFLWMHALAIGHSPAFLSENAGALWQDYPRIPLPATRDTLEASAAFGRQIAALLDVQQPVKGVTTGKINLELKSIGLITHVEGKQINDAGDLAVTAGWGNPGRGGITMPATGDARERQYAQDEQQTPDTLGKITLDIYLNDNVYWRNIPQAVWEYTLGGYQVIKKWLSYREHKVLARPLNAEEARYVTEMARRIAAILLVQPALDENYRRAASNTYSWPSAAKANT